MAAGDTTVVQFKGDDAATAKTQIESLSVVSGDIVIHWQHNNLVSVAKIKTA